MAKVKMSKKMTSIDMTAMCDVAFLLLTFFILTATAKQPEPLPVDTPNSTLDVQLPDNDLAIITIGDSGKVFFGVKSPDVRRKTLEAISAKYNVKFNEKEIKDFGFLDEFGVPVNQLPTLLGLKNEARNKKGTQAGIPHDSIDNQLADWVQYAREANVELSGNDLKFAIKGDAKEQYPQIKKVMDILIKQNVNKFNLITGLRSKDF